MTAVDPLAAWNPSFAGSEFLYDQSLQTGLTPLPVPLNAGQPAYQPSDVGAQPVDSFNVDQYSAGFYDANGTFHRPVGIGMPRYGLPYATFGHGPQGSWNVLSDAPPDQNTPPAENPPALVQRNYGITDPAIANETRMKMAAYGGGAGTPGAQALTTVPVAPLYVPGAEYQPGGENPATMAQLQAQMAQAGLYGEHPPNSTTPLYAPGVWDARSVAAYRTLLGQANNSGQDAKSELAALIEAQDKARQAGAAQQTKHFYGPILVTDSGTIASVARHVAPDLIGRYLSDAENQQLAAFFQGVQANDTRAARAATEASFSGKSNDNTVVERPPPGRGARFMEDLIRELHPTEYGAQQMGKMGQFFLQMMNKAPAGFESPGTTYTPGAYGG